MTKTLWPALMICLFAGCASTTMLTVTPDITKQMNDAQLLSCIRGRDVNYNGKTIVCVGKVKEISMFLGKAATDEGLAPIKEDLKKEFSNRHPELSQQDINEIIDGVIKIGMNKDQVILRRGNPYKINRTVTGKTVYEQWVYSSSKYLYFENGILKSWQD